MANEITYTAALKFVKDNITLDRAVRNANVTVTGDAYDARVLSISTSGTSITPTSAIGTVGLAFFRNLDDTNYVTIGDFDGGATYGALVKLKPGEFAMFRLATDVNLRAVADTANVLLEVIIVED